jgi:acetate---CoA ligase (ADP-forming)
MMSASDEVTPSSASPADRLHRAFHPRGIAVVGASRDPTKRGHQVVRALVGRGYRGHIVPVNPSGGDVMGLASAPSVETAEGPLDLAVICTPAATVPDVLRACGRRGLAGAVVLAAGFGELGEEGATLEAELRQAVLESGVRVVGPNTSGIVNLPLGLDLIGVPGARPGRLALLAQSGNMSLTLLNDAVDRPGEGFSLVIGVGNEADIAFHEYLELLAADPGIGAILIHAESFRQGARFLETARRVSRTTPIVVLKGGRTRSGDQAARSHTGAVATDHAVVRAGFRKAGIIEVTRSDDLLPVGRTLATQPAARIEEGEPGAGLVILADGGGQGTLGADTLEELGVPLANLADGTRAELRELLGPNAALGNPVDFAGAADRDPRVFARALDVLLRDRAVAGVLVVSLFGGYAIRFAAELEEAEREAAESLAGGARQAGKPLVIHSIYGERDSRAIQVLHREGVPLFRSVETACRAAAAVWERGCLLRRVGAEVARGEPAGSESGGESPLGRREAAQLLENARRSGRSALLETEARTVLAAFGVPMVPAHVCASEEAAVEAAAEIFADFGTPVVVKALSETVLHKTDAGGVALRLGTPDEVRGAVRSVREGVEAYARARGMEPGLRGVLVSPMLPTPDAELLVGVRRSPSFGAVLSLGAGGVAVELLRDVAVRILPLAEGEFEEMLDDLRIAPLLRGHRGRPGVDLAGLKRLVLGVARCAEAHPEITEIEVNPVFATPAGVVAVDARAYLEAPIPLPSGAGSPGA